MKKLLAIFMTLLMSLSVLAGCGGSEPAPVEEPVDVTGDEWATYEPDFDAEETMAMSNFMSFGRYVVSDDVLYGLTHSADLDGSLGATPFFMKGDFPEFEETMLLDSKGAALCLTMDGDYLYYIREYEAVCRVKTDGSDGEVLYNGACDYLQIHEGRLYFTDEDYHYVSTDMDGKDLKTVVEKEIYYPYFICSDWMVFQDDADHESLHLYNTTYGTEVNITDTPSHSPILDGKYLYYIDAEDGYYLCRVDMSDPEAFAPEKSELPLLDIAFMIDEQSIYTTNNNSKAKEEWYKLTDDKDMVEEYEMYVSKGYTVNHDVDEKGVITGKYLMSKTEHGGSPFK